MGTLVWSKEPDGDTWRMQNEIIKVIKCSSPWYNVRDVVARKQSGKWMITGVAEHHPLSRERKFDPDERVSLEILAGPIEDGFIMKIVNIFTVRFKMTGKYDMDLDFVGESEEGWVKVGLGAEQ